MTETTTTPETNTSPADSNRTTNYMWLALVCIGALFLLSRCLVFLAGPNITDLNFYPNYGLEYELARKNNTTLYQIHALLNRRTVAGLKKQGQMDRARLLSVHEVVEYPPLAVGTILLPQILFQPADVETGMNAAAVQNYKIIYRSMMFLVDLLMLLILGAALWRLNLCGANVGWFERMLVFVVAGRLLWPVYYDRLDIVLAALVLMAAVLLLSRAHYLFSFAVLALAINFKLVPLVLAPVWVIGALPLQIFAAEKSRSSWFRLAGSLVLRSALLVALTWIMFRVAYWVAGPQSVEFLTFHKDRGIQIESTYGSIVAVFYLFGHHINIVNAHGGLNVVSSLTPFLTQLSPIIVGLLLAAASGLMVWHFYEKSLRAGEAPERTTFAQAYPQQWVGWTVAFLLVAITGSKVFSPQYMVWLVPLVPLLSLRTTLSTRAFLWCFAVVCLFTTIIFPVMYFTDIAVMISPSERRFAPPSEAGVAMLVMRNSILIGMTVCLAVSLYRRVRLGEPAPSDEAAPSSGDIPASGTVISPQSS